MIYFYFNCINPLAEILLTLVIVGIVASLTIPAMIQNTMNAEFKTAWKSSFADVDLATRRMTLDNGGSLVGVFSNLQDMKNKYSQYLSYIKSCDSTSNSGNCWHRANEWHQLNGTPKAIGCEDGIIVSNGRLLGMDYLDSNCTSFIGNARSCGIIDIDVNGFKGPNVIGKDIFAVWVMENGVKPYGISGIDSSTCSTSSKGWSCSVDYLYK